MAILVTFLAFGGGLKSVAWTDFVSALVIVFSLVIALPLILGGDAGGMGSYWNGMPETHRTLSGGLSGMQLLGYFLPLFLLILADQNMYQRLAASKSEDEARSSTAGFFLSSFLVTVPVALLGSAAAFLLPKITPDTAILSLAGRDYLPVVLGGLLLAGALAFIITTGSSFLLSGAGNVVYDVIERFGGKELSDGRRLWVHRASVLIIGAIAYVLGGSSPPSWNFRCTPTPSTEWRWRHRCWRSSSGRVRASGASCARCCSASSSPSPGSSSTSRTG